MAEYLSNQIIQNKLDYKVVITTYPQYKKDIDDYLEIFNYIPVIDEE